MRMLAPPDHTDGAGIGSLFSRLIDEARDLVRAEIDLGKAVALSRFAKARIGIAMAGVAVLLVPSAITTLLVGCALGLRPLVGPFAGGLIVSLVTLGIAGLLAKLGIAKISAAVSGQPDTPGPKA